MIRVTISNEANQYRVSPQERPITSVMFLLKMHESNREDTIDETKLKDILQNK